MKRQPNFLRLSLALYTIKHLAQHLIEHVVFGLASHPLVTYIHHYIHF